jgi:predicted Rossmann-fold nucleotide-binding protein
MRAINTVAVFCGSNFGASPDFADGARALGRALADAGMTLVYGGTKNGLMAFSATPRWRTAVPCTAWSPKACISLGARIPA